MKKSFLSITILALSLFSIAILPAQASESLTERLSGQVLLQVESYGRAWYVNPTDNMRYYLKDQLSAFNMMRDFGLGITNEDLAKIPAEAGQTSDSALVDRLRGRIVLQVEEHGEAWYINPNDGLRYYLRDGRAAYDIMRNLSLGISNTDLAQIPMNTTQLVQDTTFDDVAYVLLQDGEVTASTYADQLLAPASMTKLMTALVLLDQPTFDWNRSIVINPGQLAYPTLYVGGDESSEVDLRTGDILTTRDLWKAMLISSSNQGTIALVGASGLSREQFVTAMNDKAAALGLTHTQFFDPTGLDAHNITTPREMALIAQAAFAEPEITNVHQNTSSEVAIQGPEARTINIIDRNYSLQTFEPDATKTGYLIEAQRCVALKKGDTIVVVMHARSMSERNDILESLLP